MDSTFHFEISDKLDLLFFVAVVEIGIKQQLYQQV